MKIKWRKITDWSIEHVCEPVKSYYNYGRNRTLLGYEVVVVYKHHGRDTLFFGVDPEKLRVITQDVAHRRATGFYERMMARKQKKENSK